MEYFENQLIFNTHFANIQSVFFSKFNKCKKVGLILHETVMEGSAALGECTLCVTLSEVPRIISFE